MYTLVVTPHNGSPRTIATDPKIRTIRGFRRAFPASVFGVGGGVKMKDLYEYAEVQEGTPEDYDVVDSESFI